MAVPPPLTQKRKLLEPKDALTALYELFISVCILLL